MSSRTPSNRHHLAAAVVFATLLGSASCLHLGVDDPYPQAADGDVRVLFVGNSLTYDNDIPGTVADLAASAGEARCYCVAVAFPDYSLGDHLGQGEAASVLGQQAFDYVVLQQGPSALPESRSDLIASTELFAPLIGAAGARAILYSVWPQANRQFDFLAGRDSYRAAAEAVNGMLAPAGMAWLQAWDRDFALPLYSGDGLHANTLGSYLAALVLFQRIYNRSPVGVQSPAIVGGIVMPWDDALVRLLQEAAAAANAVDGMP